MSMLNSEDTFSASEMTEAVDKLPLAPQRFAGMFEEEGVSTTTVGLEIRQGKITLIPDQERGAPPENLAGRGEKRGVKLLSCTHLPQSDVVKPEDLQNKRAFGSTALTGPVAVINNKLQTLKRNVEMTREFHRLGAIKGIVYDADGEKVLHNIFNTFGVQQKKETITFPAAAPEDSNPILKSILAAKRKAIAAMGGNVYSRFEAVIGSNFYDMLTGHALVRKFFEDWQARQQDFGENDYRKKGFTYAGITFYEASEVVGGQQLVKDTKGHLYPVGPGIYKTYNAPADWMETVNTVGLPFYARMDPIPKGRGHEIEVQANPLTLCLFPEALVELTAQAG